VAALADVYVRSQTGQYQQGSVDQIAEALHLIKNNLIHENIVNAWNVADIGKMALPPCHAMFQFYVINGRLDCQLYQRSADLALGVPFNIASYALLMIMFANECKLTPGIFTHTLGDAHVYLNHLEGLQKQLQRQRGTARHHDCQQTNFELQYEDFALNDYAPQASSISGRCVANMTLKKLDLIAACDLNRGIGIKMNCRGIFLRSEIFNHTSSTRSSDDAPDNIVIVGRKTWDSFKPKQNTA